MDTSEPPRVIALILAICCVSIGAGHGVGLLGMYLFGGNLKARSHPLSIGRIGIALVVIGVLISKRGLYLAFEFARLAVIVVSWLLIGFESGHAITYVIVSTPFLVVLGFLLYSLLGSRTFACNCRGFECNAEPSAEA